MDLRSSSVLVAIAISWSVAPGCVDPEVRRLVRVAGEQAAKAQPPPQDRGTEAAPPPAATPATTPAKAPPKASPAATPDEAKGGPDDVHFAIVALGRRHFAVYTPRHKNDMQPRAADGYMTPIVRASDGSFLYGGHRDDRALVVGRMDAQARIAWETRFDEKRFRSYEGVLVAEAPEGHTLAVVISYLHDNRFPLERYVKLAPDGKVVWTLELPLDEHGNTPTIHFAKVGKDGSIGLRGHAYQGPLPKTGDRPALRWTATITPDGRLTDVAFGAPVDWKNDDW